jgi:hypothetical protein
MLLVCHDVTSTAEWSGVIAIAWFALQRVALQRGSGQA